MTEKRPLAAVTMGDPGGIGPEIILKMAGTSEIPFVVIGDVNVLKKRASSLRIDTSILKLASAGSEELFRNGFLNVIHVGADNTEFKQGAPCEAGGRAAGEYISVATRLALESRVDCIVTCPVSKEALHLAGYRYSGHTEMFADLTSTTDFAMMLTAKELSVVLVTTHVAIKEICISRESVIRVIRLVHREFCRWYGEPPRIGVASLNPHAGEGGIFGNEEKDEIIPAVQEAASEGVSVFGPFPADSLFTPKKRGGFDVIITMYHDQGLIPIKMLSFGKAVNITLGLPFIRTSVDHGTAYDIVGKGIADPGSLNEAMILASDLAQNHLRKRERLV